MVTSLSEVRPPAQALEKVARRAGLARRPALGVMIEVPSAALLADRLAREADFFSIGTNDLAQYGLAVDRANPDVSALYRPLHPAILRMIQFVVEAGRAVGRPVAVCGELAGGPDRRLGADRPRHHGPLGDAGVDPGPEGPHRRRSTRRGPAAWRSARSRPPKPPRSSASSEESA